MIGGDVGLVAIVEGLQETIGRHLQTINRLKAAISQLEKTNLEQLAAIRKNAETINVLVTTNHQQTKIINMQTTTINVQTTTINHLITLVVQTKEEPREHNSCN